jgi:hypothetical protein
LVPDVQQYLSFHAYFAQVLVEGNEVANTPSQSVSGSPLYNVSHNAIGVFMRDNKG